MKASYEGWQRRSARGSPHANARKGIIRLSATRQLHKLKIHTCEDQAKEFADQKKNVGRDESLSLSRSVALRCRNRLSQRCKAHPACPAKGIIKHIDQE